MLTTKLGFMPYLDKKSCKLITMTHCSMHSLWILKKKSLELCVSRIYHRIFTRIDSLFKAGEGTLDFLTKTPSCTRMCEHYAMLRPLLGKRRTASRGDSTREFKLRSTILPRRFKTAFTSANAGRNLIAATCFPGNAFFTT